MQGYFLCIFGRHFEHDDIITRVNRGQTTTNSIALSVSTAGALSLSNNSIPSSKLDFQKFRQRFRKTFWARILWSFNPQTCFIVAGEAKVSLMSPYKQYAMHQKNKIDSWVSCLHAATPAWRSERTSVFNNRIAPDNRTRFHPIWFDGMILSVKLVAKVELKLLTQLHIIQCQHAGLQ